MKILDFGLAKVIRSEPAADNAPTLGMETKAGVVMGTVGYMSPEQVRDQAADYRADIFSMGTILYEMLTGKRAFHSPLREANLGKTLIATYLRSRRS